MEYTNDVTMREWLSQALPPVIPSTSSNLMYRPAESTAVYHPWTGWQGDTDFVDDVGYINPRRITPLDVKQDVVTTGAQFRLIDTEIADENRNRWCFWQPYIDTLEALRQYGFLNNPNDYQYAAIEEIHRQRIIDEMNKVAENVMLRVKNGESVSFGVHADGSNDNEGKLDSDMSVEELLFGGD